VAIIQNYPDELDWVNAMMRTREGSFSFLWAFCSAALHADGENYEILRPALLFFRDKYPAPAELLEAEARDRGCATKGAP
jgi:hypothetical protein